MKAILTALLIALLATPAFAQKSRPNTNDAPKPDETQKRRSAEEAAAKAASSNIPDSKEKYDPWKIAR